MKLCLGMMVHNDEAWLRLHLPVYAYCVDGMIMAVETRGECEPLMQMLKELLPGFGGHITIIVREFHNSWSEMFNHVIDYAEVPGSVFAHLYDAILRMDPDEAMFPHDIESIRELLEAYTILCFPRYNFWGDRLHYTPGIFPDWQARAWQLNKGIRLGGQHHEGINWPQYNLFEGDPVVDTPNRQVLRVPHLPIYHYGNVGKQRILERDLHYLNVAREQEGHPLLTERPADRPFPTRHSIPFIGPQPVHPNIVGRYAPYQE